VPQWLVAMNESARMKRTKHEQKIKSALNSENSIGLLVQIKPGV
jgi:hypothetical protein